MKSDDFIDRLIQRLDRLDPSSVQGYVLRLVREKGLLETIFQTVREGIVIIDRDLRIHFANSAAARLLGLPANAAGRDRPGINRYLRELNWERLLHQDAQQWERASRQEIEVFYPEHRFLQFYLLPCRDDVSADAGDEGMDMIAMILQDVTEHREHTDSTIQAERFNAITMLAAGVAHEIGNPLNSLTIHLQLLERHFQRGGEAAEDDEAGELVDIALQEVRRLDTIISQFLAAIRPAALALRPLSLKRVINAALEAIKREIQDRGILVEAQWPDAVPPIMGDEGQLTQAFYNIILNAIQAMPHGGLLHIALLARDDALAACVRDTGKGIAPENLANIFDPYYTSREDGTGLGLMIVQRIIREHGAELGVDSEVGHGTVFTVTFPLRERRIRLLDDRPGQTLTARNETHDRTATELP